MRNYWSQKFARFLVFLTGFIPRDSSRATHPFIVIVNMIFLGHIYCQFSDFDFFMFIRISHLSEIQYVPDVVFCTAVEAMRDLHALLEREENMKQQQEKLKQLNEENKTDEEKEKKIIEADVEQETSEKSSSVSTNSGGSSKQTDATEKESQGETTNEQTNVENAEAEVIWMCSECLQRLIQGVLTYSCDLQVK